MQRAEVAFSPAVMMKRMFLLQASQTCEVSCSLTDNQCSALMPCWAFASCFCLILMQLGACYHTCFAFTPCTRAASARGIAVFAVALYTSRRILVAGERMRPATLERSLLVRISALPSRQTVDQ